jgi:cathepsin A (carboxypeptidase C)
MNKMYLLSVVLWVLVFQISRCSNSTGILPGEDDSAGVIEIENKGDLFYWLIRSRDKNAEAPLVIWLNGGPGSSSLFGLFDEIGPYLMKEGELIYNQYAWNNNTDVLYIDQPVGVGFSSQKNLHFSFAEKGVAENFHIFLTKFYSIYPEYRTRSLYIAGESFGGHYIPAIAAYLEEVTPSFPLKGLLIGNGWVNPKLQYPSYETFALQNHLLKKGWKSWIIRKGFDVCEYLLEKEVFWPIPFLECSVFQYLISGMPWNLHFNQYDIREECDNPPLCEGSENYLGKFLNRDQIRNKLHVEGREWKSMNYWVFVTLLNDWVNSYQDDVAALLEKGLDIQFFNGDMDFICNWVGGEAWAENMQWSGRDMLLHQERKLWLIEGEPYADYRKVKNFQLTKVFNAGHMVPSHSPMFALEMLNDFIFKE